MRSMPTVFPEDIRVPVPSGTMRLADECARRKDESVVTAAPV